MKKAGEAFFSWFIAFCSASLTQAGWTLQMQSQRPKGHKTREPLLYQSSLYILTSIWNILCAFISKLKSNSSSHWIYSKRQLNARTHCWEIFLFNSCLSLSTVIPLPHHPTLNNLSLTHPSLYAFHNHRLLCSPLSQLSKWYKFSPFDLSSYISPSRPLITFFTLLWTPSSNDVILILWKERFLAPVLPTDASKLIQRDSTSFVHSTVTRHCTLDRDTETKMEFYCEC